jgi:hypothetical protein
MPLNPETLMARIKARIALMEAQTNQLARDLTDEQARISEQEQIKRLAEAIYRQSLRPQRPTPQIERIARIWLDQSRKLPPRRKDPPPVPPALPKP